MRLTIRSKMILYTVIPVVAVYAVLFVIGLDHVRQQLSENAQRLLVEHARHQAARVAIVLSRIPTLAGSLGDLVLADPAQSQALLYAHLIDGLRRTPGVSSAAILFGTPSRSAMMQRGASSARALSDDEKTEREPGWHLVDDNVIFVRPIQRAGEVIGRTWVDMPVDEIYSDFDPRSEPAMRILIRHQDGQPLPPPTALPAIDLDTAQQRAESDGMGDVVESADGSYWLSTIDVPDHPWRVTAMVPTRTALADAHREMALLGVALLVSLMLIVAIIGTVARQITRPLATLDDAVQRISRGDFTVAPDVRSTDELSGLASAIARMTRHIADRERQLRASHQVLEQRVSERTSALQSANEQLVGQIDENRQTHEALRAATEEAQHASRAKSEFLSNMSHELRTPLHGVLGYAQMLRRETQTDAVQRESLDAIERCGQHLLTLINDILDLTKIEAGRMNVELQATDLDQLVADVCMIVAQRADQKGLHLEHHVAPGLDDMILTDPVKLRQILLNLLGNAVKFTSSGTVVLSVGPARGGKLPFVVTDSGIGIPADKLDAIFDAFQQARDGQAVDGTGLGLAINQRLIRLLGGEALRVESMPGEGSRFEFSIPLEAAADGARSVRRPTPLAHRRHLAEGYSCRVMVVEELAENRDVLRNLLRHFGCDVETFGDQARARERLAEMGFDLLLINVRLPDPNLAEAVAKLRREAPFGYPKLVALSANVHPNAAQQACAAGFDRFLSKPFSEQQVIELVQSLTGLPVVDRPDQDAADAADPVATWPDGLASSTAERIDKGIALGDIASLFQLAEELADEPGAPQTDVEQLALMARMFDFDGLRSLADRLRNTG